MRTVMIALALCLCASPSPARDLDRRCLQGDCVILSVANGKVFATRTGEFAGQREVGDFATLAAPLVPAAEAPLRFRGTDRGWTAVAAAHLPAEFDFDAPELRLYLFAPDGKRAAVEDNYNLLDSFNVGKVLHTDDEFAQISTTGAHAYVVRTSVWYLPASGGLPKHVLDVPGILTQIQDQTAAAGAGLVIDRQTYDGVHAETKGLVKELWLWRPDQKTFVRREE